MVIQILFMPVIINSFAIYQGNKASPVSTVSVASRESLTSHEIFSELQLGTSQFQNLLYLAGDDPSHPPSWLLVAVTPHAYFHT